MSTNSSQKSSTTSSHQPLSELCANTTSPKKSTTSEETLKQPAEEKMPTTQSEQAATYISPSDAMLSPTSKKLSEIKGRRFGNAKTTSLNAKNLFARAREEKENQMSLGSR